jgi:hypothetical protein
MLRARIFRRRYCLSLRRLSISFACRARQIAKRKSALPGDREGASGVRAHTGPDSPRGAGTGTLNNERMAQRLLRSVGGAIVILAARIGNLGGDQAGILPDLQLDGLSHVGMLLEKSLGVLATLTDALAGIGEPGA